MNAHLLAPLLSVSKWPSVEPSALRWQGDHMTMFASFGFLRDNLINALSGRGTAADKSAHSFWLHQPMGEEQVIAAYRSSWLIRKIVDLVADDMTREWRTWSLKADQVKAIEELEQKLNIQEEILAGLRYGRLGGGIVLIGTKGNLAREARDGEELLYVKALPKQLVSLGEVDWDVGSASFGEPKYFILNGTTKRDQIHPSRVIVFKGEAVPNLVSVNWEDAFWGDSVVSVVDRAVRNVDSATDGFASLVEEAKVDIYKLAGLADTLMQNGGKQKVQDRVDTTNQSKSNWRAIYLDGEDDWQQKQINWTGMPDVIKAYLMVAAGAADIPATRLYGKAPDGQNSTGDSDDRNYRSMIMTRQKRTLRPGFDKIDRFLLPAAKVDADATWVFSPLSTPTEKELADINKIRVETFDAIDRTGLVPRDALALAVQATLVEYDVLPSLAEELDKLPDEELVPEPEINPLDPSALQTPEGIAAVEAAGAKRAGQISVEAKKAKEKPKPKAVNDAEPRSLYVSRPVLNGAEIIAWARSQGFASTLDAADLHTTLIWSDVAIDWMKVESNWGQDDDGGLLIKPGGARLVEPIGGKGAIALLYTSSELSWRHEQLKQAGAISNHADFQPHVTITWDKPADFDPATVVPYRGAIRLGPEIWKEVDNDWTPPAQ